MNGEWFFLVIVPSILSLALAYIAYRLGLRSQRIQGLREYITVVVKDEYPALFSEIRKNSEYLGNYLETTYIYFHRNCSILEVFPYVPILQLN